MQLTNAQYTFVDVDMKNRSALDAPGALDRIIELFQLRQPLLTPYGRRWLTNTLLHMGNLYLAQAGDQVLGGLWITEYDDDQLIVVHKVGFTFDDSYTQSVLLEHLLYNIKQHSVRHPWTINPGVNVHYRQVLEVARKCYFKTHGLNIQDHLSGTIPVPVDMLDQPAPLSFTTRLLANVMNALLQPEAPLR